MRGMCEMRVTVVHWSCVVGLKKSHDFEFGKCIDPKEKYIV